MTEKKPKQERGYHPALWMQNFCPACKHSAQMIYKPALLPECKDLPVIYKCQSEHNPLRQASGNVCHQEWSVEVNSQAAEEIRHHGTIEHKPTGS